MKKQIVKKVTESVDICDKCRNEFKSHYRDTSNKKDKAFQRDEFALCTDCYEDEMQEIMNKLTKLENKLGSLKLKIQKGYWRLLLMAQYQPLQRERGSGFLRSSTLSSQVVTNGVG